MRYNAHKISVGKRLGKREYGTTKGRSRSVSQRNRCEELIVVELYEIITLGAINFTIVLDVMKYNLVQVNRRFG
jgi:hypothetical protein